MCCYSLVDVGRDIPIVTFNMVNGCCDYELSAYSFLLSPQYLKSFTSILNIAQFS